MAERAAPRSLNDRVAAVANGALALAGAMGCDDLAASLSGTARRWPLQEVTVVVAGESGRGRSSFANAVIGRDSLLPTGTIDLSPALLTVRRGTEERLTVRLAGGEESVIGPVDALDRWMAGERGDVDTIEVSLVDTNLPSGVCIVATPGVGEATNSSRELAARALGLADVVIVVCDPSAPLSAPELSYITEARRRVATVLLVMTKVDQFAGWKQILKDDLDLLARDGRGEVPVFPVSVRLAQRALAAPDAERSAELLAESGLGPVIDLVCRGVAGRSQVIRMSNLVRLSHCVADTVETSLRARAGEVEGETSAEAAASLDEERRRVEELRDAGTRYQTWLNDRFASLREQLINDATIGIREVMEHYEAVLADYREAPDRLVEEVGAAIGRAESAATDAFATSVRATVAELATMVREGERRHDVVGRPAGRVDAAALRVAHPAPRVDRLAVFRAASTVGGLGTSLSFLLRTIGDVKGWGIAAAMVGCFTLTASAGVGSLVVGSRQREIDQMRLQLRALGDAARTELGPMLRERAVVMQRSVEEELRALLRERTREYQGRLADAQNAQRVDASERQKARQDLAQRVRDVERLRAEADALADELHVSLTRALQSVELAGMPDQRPPAPSYPERSS